MDLIEDIKTRYVINVQYAWCENTWENEDLEKVCEQEGMDAQFEYTMQGTPQQTATLNGKMLYYFIGYMQCSTVRNSLLLPF